MLSTVTVTVTTCEEPAVRVTVELLKVTVGRCPVKVWGLGGTAAALRLIVIEPVKPVSAVTVTVTWLDDPSSTVITCGEAPLIEKPGRLTSSVKATLWVMEAPVAVTLKWKVPVVVEFRVRMETALPPLMRLTLVALKVARTPVGAFCVRLTVPTKL